MKHRLGMCLPLFVLLVVAVTGCSDSGQSAGHLTATIREVGGPAPGLNRLVAGKVTLTDTTGHVHSATSANGRIAMDLASGTYHAVATSPLINSGDSPCNGPDTVSVKTSETTHASFVCDIR